MVLVEKPDEGGMSADSSRSEVILRYQSTAIVSRLRNSPRSTPASHCVVVSHLRFRLPRLTMMLPVVLLLSNGYSDPSVAYICVRYAYSETRLLPVCPQLALSFRLETTLF